MSPTPGPKTRSKKPTRRIGISVDMTEELRSKLNVRAQQETAMSPPGVRVSMKAIVLRYINEGLAKDANRSATAAAAR